MPICLPGFCAVAWVYPAPTRLFEKQFNIQTPPTASLISMYSYKQ